MARKVSFKIYVFSFILTILIFSLGLSIGLLVEKERLQEFDKMNMEQEVDLKSMQMQQRYIDIGGLNCEALTGILEANMEEVSESMDTVLDYNENSVIDSEVFELQLRDYFLTEIQYYLVANQIKEVCDNDVVTFLYFYDEDENDIQGQVLDYLKSVFGNNLLVFSFDSNFKEEPMIDVLIETYDIETFPTVVANGVVFEGGVGADELHDFICEELNNNHDECLN